jgi:hypothetical protein
MQGTVNEGVNNLRGIRDIGAQDALLGAGGNERVMP